MAVRNTDPVVNINMVKKVAFKYLKAKGMLSPLGSGEHIELKGKISIKPNIRKKYTQSIKESYYENLSETSEVMVKTLEDVGLVPVVGRDEVWVGNYTGALSDGDSWRGKLDLVTKDGEEVKNSKLIINLYKDNSKNKRYELNTYLS